MIQRQQSLWLLLSGVCAFLTFRLPFYSGTVKPGESNPVPSIDAGDNLFLLLLTAIEIIISVVTIFLYKERKRQIKFAIGGAVLSAIIITLYFVAMRRFATGSIAIWAIFAIGAFIGFIMAARGIWKDEKLVKSLDKLR